MSEENGKNPESMTNNPSKIFEKPIKEMSINTIKEKYIKNELIIEDILNSNECINDLKTNQKSKYATILSTQNIHKLISYCIYPSKSKVDISYKTLRYPYYSCEILCSPCILQFSKSIKNIKEANDLQNKLRKNDNELNYLEGNESDDASAEKKDDFGEDNMYDFNQVKDYQPQNEQNDLMMFNENNNNFYENYNNEIFQDFNELQRAETEMQKDTMENDKKTQFSDEDNEIINEILNKIFGFLDLNFYLDETYTGYFQKIVNFLFVYESRITFNYLEKDNNLVIKKFFRHLGNASIENIFENILNYISDQENVGDTKFNMIIIELFDEIGSIINKEYDKNDKKELINYYEDKNKIEFICELIINTLINNTERHLIELVISSTGLFLPRITLLIKKAVNLEFSEYYYNNKKTLIINLIEILLQLNKVIMNSNSIKDDINFFKDPYTKIKNFENQYFCKKEINKENIYEAFLNNIKYYITSIKNIFDLIKEDIKKYPYLDSNNEKGLTLMLLSEWKCILNCIKMFIFQFYSNENIIIEEKNQDFYDEGLFELSLKLYNDYPKNNLYQNIFMDLIKIVNFEKTPNYLISYFINNQKFFIDNLKKIIDIQDKFRLLLGPNIQILLLFYSSSNPVCLEFFNLNNINNNKNEIITKKIFENLIQPKFTRDFKDIYEFTENEIFSDLNDSMDTFDGNDIDSISKMKFQSLKSIIFDFFFKLSLSDNEYINKLKMDKMSNNNTNNNQSIQENPTIKQTSTSISGGKIIQTQITNSNKTGGVPSLSRKDEFEIKKNQ